MFITILVLSAYLLLGVGFSLASWLQSAELEVEAGKKPSPFFSRTFLSFLLAWPAIALYCYRAEVKKSIAKVDFESLKKD